jgi:hypothetical protein
MSGQQLDVNEDGHLVPIQDRISNPFDIMPDQHNQPANRTNGDIGATLNTVSEGERKHSPLIESFAKDAAAKSLL